MSENENAGSRYRHVIMVSAEPRGLIPPGRTVWVVYRNHYPRERPGLLKSLLGIENKYDRKAAFEDSEEAIEYGLSIAKPHEKVVLSGKRGGQKIIRKANADDGEEAGR